MTTIENAIARFSRVPLTRTPTPYHRLPGTSAAFGADVWSKRDDLTDLAFGGDKPRKLEYALAPALEAKASILVGSGSTQSNFARLLSAAARQLGLESAVVLARDRHPELQGNLLLTHILGARVRVVDSPDLWSLDGAVDEFCDELRSEGHRPFVVPVSGTTPLTTLGYIRAGLETIGQFRKVGAVPDVLYVPFGTGGIFTGILAALRSSGCETRLAGVSVNRDAAGCEDMFRDLWKKTHELLQIVEPPAGDYEITDEYVGADYGDPTARCLDAIIRIARLDGLFTDPVYSGKVAAALLNDLEAGRHGAATLGFLHSGGGPALFAYATELGQAIERGQAS
jgi:1-aminocyclopropane-1-carboxylate deaminase/D-cysteine desulfhydrase-like pyridoxal-dependent ACC family enzyme